MFMSCQLKQCKSKLKLHHIAQDKLKTGLLEGLLFSSPEPKAPR